MSVDREFNITIKLSNEFCKKLDLVVELEQLNCEQLVIRALHHYVCERKNEFLREQLQRGYLKMADINLDLACECFGVEEEADIVLLKIERGV